MKLMVLDGNSIVNRAFYGVGYLSSRSGQPTGAIYGFLNILQSLLDEETPDALCVAFDEKGPTFRNQTYTEYKANRKPMPEDLAVQLPVLKDILHAMNIHCYGISGWEADDVLGTIGTICSGMGWNCTIVTGDRDVLQLVDPHVSVRLITTKSGSTHSVNYTPAVFQDTYGFAPAGLIDLKALMGDSSDNYPGVPGIGQKTATVLIQTYGTLDEVYAHLEEQKTAIRNKLESGRDMAYLCYDLATIRKNAPIVFSPEENSIVPWNREKVLELFRSLEFTRLIEKYHLLENPAVIPAQEGVTKPASLKPSAAEWAGYLREAAAQEFVAVSVSNEFDALSVSWETRLLLAERSDLGESNWANLCAELFSASIKKSAHDVKTLQRTLLAHGLSADGFVYDTALASYLLDPARSGYPLHEIAERYGCLNPADTLDASASAVFSLTRVLPPLVAENGMASLYREIDLPLCRVLAEMEHVGICVDRDSLNSFREMLSQRIDDCESLIYSYAGGTFNIKSTKQLSTLLFDKLALPTTYVKKTSYGYSTNIEVLEKLKDLHPVIPAIIDYRMLTKLHSTYAEGLLKVIGPDGRIHTTFQNMVTATGRLSSTDPNLQNIPIRTELGGEIRKMFVPRPGWVLVDADYSQIELRVLSHVADDKNMQAAFSSGEDFHTHTAATVFGVDPTDVTPQMRRSAKAVNFGIIYGISDYSLAGDIGVSRKEAKAYIDGYLNHYSGVKAYMHNVVETARETGYVESLYGRRRALPELKSSNFNVRSGAERIALNSPIQGTAADIIKIAMIRVADRIRSCGLQARLILQVHDELIVECPESEQEQVTALLTEEMEQAARLKVALVAEAHAGKSWYDAK